VTDITASMTMTEAFPEVWLPRRVDVRFGAMFAVGAVDARYRVDYLDYRQATTAGRLVPLTP
jgi:hypothetical protein